MTVKEYWAGITGDQDRRFVRYLVDNAPTDIDALNQLELGTPTGYDGLSRENITVREYSAKDGLWEGIARYTRRSFEKPAEDTNAAPVNVTGPSEPSEEDPDKGLYSFDVAVETRLEIAPDNVTQYVPVTNEDGEQIATKTGQTEAGVGFYELGPSDGYQFDPSYGYRGRDLLRPRGSFTLDIYPDNASVNRTYEALVADMVGKVNNVRFRRYEPGELMLVAARGESRNNADWQFSFTFQIKKNRTNVNLGNGVTFAAVDGWDVIDPIYVEHTVDLGTTKAAFHRCRQAIVWRPYKRDDFQKLII